jgi:hypothetical protein
VPGSSALPRQRTARFCWSRRTKSAPRGVARLPGARCRPLPEQRSPAARAPPWRSAGTAPGSFRRLRDPARDPRAARTATTAASRGPAAAARRARGAADAQSAGTLARTHTRRAPRESPLSRTLRLWSTCPRWQRAPRRPAPPLPPRKQRAVEKAAQQPCWCGAGGSSCCPSLLPPPPPVVSLIPSPLLLARSLGKTPCFGYRFFVFARGVRASILLLHVPSDDSRRVERNVGSAFAFFCQTMARFLWLTL